MGEIHMNDLGGDSIIMDYVMEKIFKLFVQICNCMNMSDECGWITGWTMRIRVDKWEKREWCKNR